MINKNFLIIILTLILLFFVSNSSYAMNSKSIVILLDELNLNNIEKLLSEEVYGIGFMNLKTKKPYSSENLYLSIGVGRKVGIGYQYYKGLYKDLDGSINIISFKDIIEKLSNKDNLKIYLLGDILKDEGISYIGNNSSAIIGADNKGKIRSGELEVIYKKRWLMQKTIYHLSNSQVLILSYNMGKSQHRYNLLKGYLKQFKNCSIMIIPTGISQDMKYIINKTLVPIIYINGNNKGVIQSCSTKRTCFITLEDIHAELLANNGKKSPLSIGNRINIIKNPDNISYVKEIFKKTINLINIAYLYHGIVCLMQIYSAYNIYKNKNGKLENINIYNNLIVVNMFISLLMGISSFHINIVLYILINFVTTYIITMFVMGRVVNTIGLFSTLTYMIIVAGMFFKPEILYNSYIGFNNFFYGFRYYGLNNGIMGVLLVSSVISYFFIGQLFPNKIINNIVCLCYFILNILVLSANYGANTGGFISAIILLLIMIYVCILNKNSNIANMFILVFIGLLIFFINMYFDYFSDERSHTINFLLRIKTFGLSEFINMFKIKAKELVSLTVLPPFGLAIVSQIYCLRKLPKTKGIFLEEQISIIFFIAIIAFLLNDTGMIAFIYIVHYLISLQIHNIVEPPYNSYY